MITYANTPEFEALAREWLEAKRKAEEAHAVYLGRRAVFQDVHRRMRVALADAAEIGVIPIGAGHVWGLDAGNSVTLEPIPNADAAGASGS